MLDVKRLRSAGGCYPTCMVVLEPDASAATVHVRHNTVRLARHAALTDKIVEYAGERLYGPLGAWLAAHHRGDTSNPFNYPMRTPEGGESVFSIHEVD